MTMSPEEHAIEQDLELGISNGVILVEETDRDESSLSTNEITYHMRAKILTAEGRDLADVTIPFNNEDSKLKRWWGRTILPDGTVFELGQDELEEQSIIRTRWTEYSVLKGTLPGVVPGCVIDYGYQVRVEGFTPPSPVSLQRAWPICDFRYRWEPWHGLSAAYYVTGGDRVKVDVKKTDEAVLISARNTDPVVVEPLGPPDSAIRAVLYLYYSDAKGEIGDYWHDKGKDFEFYTERFAGSKSKRKKLLEQVGLPPDGEIDANLRQLYDWITANIENTSLRTHEERARIADDDDDESPENAKETMKYRRGSKTDLDQLFIGLARVLGAEAHLVLAPDRTQAFWQPKIFDISQFGGFLVAIGSQNEPLIFVDPGSGLPFGQVPWWFSGIPGALASEEGIRQVMIRGSKPQQNVSATRVEMAFEDDNSVLVVEWNRDGTGQAGYSEKLLLRARSVEKREERLRELCGEDTDLEVVEASAPSLLSLADGFQLQCSCEVFGTGIDESTESFRAQLTGPWIEELPDLTDETRTQAVILPFPRIDTTVFSIDAPAGFDSIGPSEPIVINSPVGGYSLRFVKRPGGYNVVRSLTLSVLSIDAKDYSVLLDFLNAIRSADQTQLVFTRTSPA